MKYIFTALHCEARSLIEALKLKRNMNCRGFDIFQSPAVNLCVTGVGKVKAAIAIANACALLQPGTNDYLLNVGICGARPTHRVGELFYINSIRDSTTQRCYFPDVIMRHGFNEASIETFDEPVTSEAKLHPTTELADMECSGFIQAALAYVSTHQVAALKIVSDNFTNVRLNEAFISELVAAHTPKIIDFILNLPDSFETSKEALDQNEISSLENFSKEFKFTSSQNRIFLDACKKHLLTFGTSPLKRVQSLGPISVSNSDERKGALEKLRAGLATA